MSARRLPEAIKDFHRRFKQILRGMHAASFVTEKWSLQVDTERPSLRRITVRGLRNLSSLDRVRKAFERKASLVKRCGHCSWEIAGHSVSRKKFMQMRQLGRRCSHDIETGAAVHVNVDDPRHQNRVTKIDHRGSARYFPLGP